ncbi:MAG: hypothetical protein HY042_08675 [Spirochaetia bacterium]|nr:hypothetical protein [Spirochaetia bacterium]
MSVRDMNGDPAVWEALVWADMNPHEQALWTELGWTPKVWDTQVNVPATASMEWKNLTREQQRAASDLGFTEEVWDGFEDQ